MLSRNQTFAALLILWSITLVLLVNISPHWTAARASYQVTVVSKDEIRNLSVSAQTYDSFNTSAYSFPNMTADANYTVGTQSGKLAGTNTTVATFGIFIRRLRAGGEVSVIFPLVPLGLRDVNINGSLAIFPTVEPQDQINRISEITTRVTIQSESGSLLYSYYNTATISDGQLKWSVFPQEKNLSVFSLQLFLALLSLFASALMLLPFSLSLRGNFPYATVLASSSMFAIYALVGTGNDLLYKFGFNQTPQILELLFGPLFHTSFGHVAGNVFFGFLINGFLIEAWLRGKLGRLAYVWLAAGYVLSVAFEYIVWFRVFGTSGVGASFWVIALSIVLYEYLSRRKVQFGEQEFLVSLLAGFSIIQASYSYIVDLTVFYYNEFSRDTGVWHLAFLIFSFAVVHSALWISGRRAKISEFLKKILSRT